MTEPRTCPSCSAETTSRSKYCAECGVRLSSRALLDTGPPVSQRRPHVLNTAAGRAQEDSADAPLADPLIGVTIAGRYRIIEPLGRGGMGVVYRVEHARIGKLMALKLLTGELSRDPEVVARFKREALMVSKLSHPNTVQVFDFGTAEGMTYLAMEYLRGEDLGRVIRREGPLGAERMARLVVQVCSSLSEAHRLDIIHRDLKPENVFVLQGPSGSELIKVLDFGLAKLRESTELGEVTSRGAIVGTPFYMSPEQIRGESADQRSDVYALGALMHMCLTAEPPFDAPRPMGVLTKHLVEAARDPSERYPELNIPPGLSAIVLKALQKEPERRFASVDDLQRALIAELRDEGQPSAELLLDSGQMQALAQRDSIAATRDEVERYERKLRRRGALTWIGLGAALLALLVGGYQVISLAQRPPAFAGEEREPNNAASEANPVPFGSTVRGQLGRRLAPDRSDRDFFRVDVPEDVTNVRLSLSALPNLALCVWVYRMGIDSPLGTYCPGGAGRPLEVPVLELSPGPHYLAVMQDRDGYAETPPPVLENVSDQYVLALERVEPSASHESEPNDTEKDANVIDGSIRGRLAWMRDVDVVCAKPGGAVRFVISDAPSRPVQAVLQVTPRGGEGDGIPVRIHAGRALDATGSSDVPSPWTSPVVQASDTERACLTLTLVPNPLAPLPLPKIAPASPEEYLIRVEPD
ncbi:MAG: protein kinase [Polyangiaceae bacterium]|nr:protein kinase [Polyangiaceae bacterium]